MLHEGFLNPRGADLLQHLSAFILAISLKLVSFFFFKKSFSDSFIESALGWFSVQFSGYFSIMLKLLISKGHSSNCLVSEICVGREGNHLEVEC